MLGYLNLTEAHPPDDTASLGLIDSFQVDIEGPWYTSVNLASKTSLVSPD